MLDHTRLDLLRRELGHTSLQEIFIIFEEECQTAINNLKLARCPDQIVQAAHFLRGNCANLGLTQLAKLCQAIETSATTSASTNAQVDMLEQVFRRSIDELQLYLSTQSN